MVRQRMAAGAASSLPDIQSGIEEASAYGTAVIGEIATSADSQSAMYPGRAVVFREIIGFARERIDDQCAIAERHLAEGQVASLDHSQLQIRHGLSPHAPYSVHPELFRRVIELARTSSAPVAMHIAETRDELRFLRDQTGRFRQLLEDFGVWDAAALTTPARPMNYLQLLATVSHALVVHGNYLEQDELQFIADNPSLTLVYCPRTHAWFRHAAHPWRRAMELGCRVAIGTDSRASNPNLNLFAELQFLAKSCTAAEKRTLLKLAISNGAVALGMPASKLRPGDRADLVVVALPNQNLPPHDLLFHPAARVIQTWIGGRAVAGGDRI